MKFPAIVKSKDFAYSPSGTMDYTTMNWTAGLSPGPLSGQTSTASMDIRSVFAINHTSAMVGGLYTSPKVYARLITDESLRYSTKFWYDKLGRIVLSQNTRQFNLAIKTYSYTLFDAFGRVIEAGEKMENTAAADKKFADIFGTQVNNHWNQNVIDDVKLNTWITTLSASGGGGKRNEVTRSYYDKVETAIGATLPGTFTQTELPKRISCVAYYPEFSVVIGTTGYDHATHYSYDIHGSVKSLLQENRKLAVLSGAGVNVTDERYNRIDYVYDLISNNVHKASYETGKADQWFHKFTYDADNRLLDVSTSDNDQIWDKDAKYIYFDHGVLARTEYGQNNVQAMDHAYNLNGWLKGVNSNDLNTKRDMGQDGYLTGTNPNQKFAFDVAGYTLNYYNEDYKPIDAGKWSIANKFEADKIDVTNPLVPVPSNIDITGIGLYNGNIKAMVTTITNPTTNAVLPQAMLYGYDQLNRLKDAKAFANLGTVNVNNWANTTYAGLYENYFRYDANGNITKQVRKNETGTAVERLSYGYYKGLAGKLLKNRLYHVDDVVSAGTFTDDIDDMTGTFDSTNAAYNTAYNYSYDAQGRLIRDDQEKITNIKWTVGGKVSEVIRTAASGKKALKFDYDAMGNRIAKHQYNETGTTWEKSTYYVFDASGNIVASYEKTNSGSPSMKVKEREIYGLGRIGMYTKQVEMISAPTPSTSNFTHETALRYYEISNHLGNVLSVITDRKKPIDDGDHDSGNDGVNESNGSLGAADNQVDYYRAEILSSNDYMPYGVYQTGRNFSTSSYAIGFNGMRKDSELKSEGNSYDFGARLYDSRLGKWLTTDPDADKQPSWSTYKAFKDNPLIYTDPNGETEYESYKLIRKDGSEKTVTVPISNDIKTDGLRFQVGKTLDCPEGTSKVNYYDFTHQYTVTEGADGQFTYSYKVVYGSVVKSTETASGQKPGAEKFNPADLKAQFDRIMESYRTGKNRGGVEFTSKDAQGNPEKSNGADNKSEDIDGLLAAIKGLTGGGSVRGANLRETANNIKDRIDAIEDLFDAITKESKNIPAGGGNEQTGTGSNAGSNNLYHEKETSKDTMYWIENGERKETHKDNIKDNWGGTYKPEQVNKIKTSKPTR